MPRLFFPWAEAKEEKEKLEKRQTETANNNGVGLPPRIYGGDSFPPFSLVILHIYIFWQAVGRNANKRPPLAMPASLERRRAIISLVIFFTPMVRDSLVLGQIFNLHS